MSQPQAAVSSGPAGEYGTLGRLVRAHWPWAIPALAIFVLISPMLFTDRAFNGDWISHLWEVWIQSRTIRQHGLPGYYFHADPLGAFYPVFVFYGGTLFSLAGYLALVGGATFAYIAFFLIGFCMAYGGWTWLSHQAGLGGWQAQLPGLVFVTSAYYLSNAYARGAWAEFLATSAVPLVVASTAHLVRARQWRLGPLLAFVFSVVILTGSHNISLAWSAVCLVFLALVVLVALPRHGRELPGRRVAALAGLGALAVGVNLWFLAPDLFFASRTLAPKYGWDWGNSYFVDVNKARVIFDPLRFNPAGRYGGGFYPQVPTLALLWALLALGLSYSKRFLGPRPLDFWRIMALGLFALLAGLIGLVLLERPWALVPQFLKLIQFSFRLHTYIALCVTGLVLLGLVAVKRAPMGRLRPRLVAGLVAVVALGAGVAVWQVWSQPSGSSFLKTRGGAYRSATETPAYYPPAIFRDSTKPVIAVATERKADLDVKALAQGKLTQRLNLPLGSSAIKTNLSAGPYLVSIKGVRWVGRTKEGFAVVRREPGDERAQVEVSVAARRSLPVTLGIAGTAASLAALLTLLVGYLVRRRWAARA